jgi:hypothetical protein
MSLTAYIVNGHLLILFLKRGFRLLERGFLGNYSFGFFTLFKHMSLISFTFLRNACFAHLYLRRSFSKTLEVRDYTLKDYYFIL